MHRHKYFNLWLHDDGELAPLVQGEVVERVTLHEWPLACVQRLITSDGRTLIYKTQYGPTVEPVFYASARSALLALAQTIYRADDGHVCMLIEFVEGPSLEDLNLPEAEVAHIGRALLEQIGEIAGELPFFVDVSTEDKWTDLVNTTLQGLGELIGAGKFSRADKNVVNHLERWAFSQAARSAIRTRPGYVHHDLGGDNIFVLPGQYRVIDWQRPIVGPADLDLATLIESSGFDPLKYVETGVVWVMYLLRVHWLVQCALQWFPPGAADYDEAIARLAVLIGE